MRRLAVVATSAACLWTLQAAATASATTPQSTCTPGTKVYSGPYVDLDNAWLETRQCVRFNPDGSLTITSNAVPNGSTVVAYLSRRDGEFWTFRDIQSGFPMKVTHLGQLTLHVASTGRAGGAWQSDSDLYFHPNPASIVHHHATFELVISNRYAWRIGGKGDPWIRIHRTWYRWSSWITCQRVSAQAMRSLPAAQQAHLQYRPVLQASGAVATAACDPAVADWRIAVFWQVHEKARSRMFVPAYTWFLIRQHLLPRSDWLSSAAYGTEAWQGAKGLTDSLTVTGAIPPHIAPPGGKS